MLKPPISVSTTIPYELAEFIEAFCKQFRISKASLLREAIQRGFLSKAPEKFAIPDTSYFDLIEGPKKQRSRKYDKPQG